MVLYNSFTRFNPGRYGNKSLAEAAALTCILVLAAILRFVGLGDLALWTDEALTIVLAKWSVGEMLRYPTDPTPFLYYWLHGLLFSPLDSAARMRSLSVGAGVLSVALIYVLARLSFNRRIALFAAALLAVSGSHIAFSQEARQYSLLFSLTLLSSIGLVLYARSLDDAAETEAGRAWARRLGLSLFCLGNVLSWYSHATAAIWIALTSIMLLGAALAAPDRKARLTEVALAYGIMAICAVPGLLWILAGYRYGHEHVEWLQQPGPVQFMSRVAEIYLPRGFWNLPWISGPEERLVIKSVVAAAGGLGLIAAVVRALPVLKARFPRHRLALLLVLSYLAAPVVIWIVGFVSLPVLLARTVLYSLPGFILLLAILLPAEGKWALRAPLAILGIYLASTIIEIPRREKDDYRGAADHLAAHLRAGDVILVCPSYDYPGLRHATQAVIPAPVLAVMGDDKILQLEAALGSDLRWDESFHRLVLVPELEARLGARLGEAPAPSLLTPGSVWQSLAPGAAVWRFDGRCKDSWSRDDVRTHADRAVNGLTLDPQGGWRQVSWVDGKLRLQISRYVRAMP
ncbi:MAG: hypothetical protein HEQ16_07165 [Bosea sp.]|jgi:mannosyltransferase|nr:hypothetical protein [Bosea sp. (in: a-proteobacteria)]